MPTPAIVVPLYIYPAPGAWSPLLVAADSHPHVSFIIIVNPASGPGATPLPDLNYVETLKNLRARPNITILGYVHFSYGARPVDDVRGDIDRYASWELVSGGSIKVDGIFLDETPWEPSARGSTAAVAHHVRRAWVTAANTRSPGSGATPSPLVMYNPGAPVGPGYMSDVDHVVVYEQAAAEWSRFVRTGAPQISPSLRWRGVIMVHSCVPALPSLSPSPRSPLGPSPLALVLQARQLGFGGVYLTDQLGGGYTRWPVIWDAVVAAVAASGQL